MPFHQRAFSDHRNDMIFMIKEPDKTQATQDLKTEDTVTMMWEI